MNFQKHTSIDLVDLFHKKPFQGQAPEKAQIIFLSSDANYSPEISNHSFFNYILEYQENGVEFWQKHKCHHPFSLPNYPFNKNKAGVPFHRNFSKIGLKEDHAQHVSFLELLDIPTIGNKSQNKKLFYELISEKHLRYIENLMTGGGKKLFFISNGVLKDIERIQKTYDCFKWLNLKTDNKEKYSYSTNGNSIKEIYHFSSWQIHGQLEDIYTMINTWLIKNK